MSDPTKRAGDDGADDDTGNAEDTFGWTDEPGDPDAAGPPAEFVDTPPAAPGAGTDPPGG